MNLVHSSRPILADGGIETDLIFHHGIDLPEFAAFVLLDNDAGRSLLVRYWESYAALASAAGAGLQLETPPGGPGLTPRIGPTLVRILAS